MFAQASFHFQTSITALNLVYDKYLLRKLRKKSS